MGFFRVRMFKAIRQNNDFHLSNTEKHSSASKTSFDKVTKKYTFLLDMWIMPVSAWQS